MVRFDSNHITADTLEEYSFARLSEKETERVEEHLLVCEHCRNLLEDTEADIRLLKQAARTVRATEPAPKRAPWWATPRYAMATAAAAVVLVVGGSAWRNSGAQPHTIELRALRSADIPAVPAGTAPELALSAEGLTGAADAIVSIVDGSGTEVWSGASKAESGKWRVRVPVRLQPGAYWVHVKDNGGTQLREYGLRVE